MFIQPPAHAPATLPVCVSAGAGEVPRSVPGCGSNHEGFVDPSFDGGDVQLRDRRHEHVGVPHAVHIRPVPALAPVLEHD